MTGSARPRLARRFTHFASHLAVALPLVAVATSASAQTRNPLFANPPILGEATAPAFRVEGFAANTTPAGPSPRRDLDLTVRYIDNSIYNPATDRADTVKLRGYTGLGVDPAAPYVAPVIEVVPGQRVTVALHNELPPDPSCTAAHPAADTPHCFNGTNLHSHGLWVSPAGNGDNVLVSINPGKSFTYFYDLPDDHPAGTFWYHTHRHGSTALQVSSGMAGALIVRGDRLPGPTVNGDLDTLLKNGDGSRMEERLLVLQQIQYACRDAAGTIKTGPEGWVCDPGDVGQIESYDQFGPGTWAASGRYTTINGLVRPHFEARAGRVERWRLIHGGVRDTITLAFRPRKANAPEPVALTKAAAKQYIADYCAGAPIAYHLAAADGLTMKAAQKTTTATLQPGYRNDALVIFPTAGDYCVTNEPIPGAGSVTQAAQDRQLLATVAVAPGTPAPDATVALKEALVAAARRTMPPAIRAAIVADLEDGLKLTRFVPHPDIAADELTGAQELVFFIDVNVPPKSPPKFEVGNRSIDPRRFDPALFTPRPYDPGAIDRLLPLGGVEQWTLQSAFVSHPFHIHVNPFQIVEILDPNGVDVSAPGAVDKGGGTIDPQYPGLKGVWKDTLWVKSLVRNFPADIPKGVYTLKVRTRYQRYIGEYVLHCHILDHEDQGMMQNVCVDLADGGGTNCRALLRNADAAPAAHRH